MEYILISIVYFRVLILVCYYISPLWILFLYVPVGNGKLMTVRDGSLALTLMKMWS